MKSLDKARELARVMVRIGRALNKKTIAVITDMNQPLGHEVGNAGEVREAAEFLQGRGARDLTAVALTLASHMAVLGGAYNDLSAASRELARLIDSGSAFQNFKKLIRIQGGDPDVLVNPGRLPRAKYHVAVKAPAGGYVTAINAEAVGMASMLLGAGRKKKDDPVDYSAGVTLVKKIGDRVQKGETICILHTNLAEHQEAGFILQNAYSFSDLEPAPLTYVHEVIQ